MGEWQLVRSGLKESSRTIKNRYQCHVSSEGGSISVPAGLCFLFLKMNVLSHLNLCFVWVSVCMGVCASTHVSVCMYVFVCMHPCMSVYLPLCVSMRICIWVCVLCVCCVCVSVRVYYCLSACRRVSNKKRSDKQAAQMSPSCTECTWLITPCQSTLQQAPATQKNNCAPSLKSASWG